MIYDVAIVGGGIAGLSCAYRWLELARSAKRPLSLVVLEASSRPGGKLQTQREAGWVVEAAADGFLTRKPAAMDWIDKLGLSDRLISPITENRKTYVRAEGRLHALPEGFSGLVPVDLDALRASTLLSPEGLARFLAEESLPASASEREETIEEFFRRRFGDEAFERLFEPLLSGISSGASNRIGMESAFGHFVALEREGRSILSALRSAGASSSGGFRSLETGMAELVEALAQHVGKSLRTRSRVVRADYGDLWNLELESAEVVRAHNLVVATPAPVAAELVSTASPELSEELARVEYTSVGVVHLRYPASVEASLPRGSGFLVARGEGLAFTACTFSSRKWQNRAPKDGSLVRFYAGEKGLDLGREALFDAAEAEIRRLVGTEVRALSRSLTVWTKSVPVLVVGHKTLVRSIDERANRLPRFQLCGSYFDGVGIPDTLARSQSVAERAFESIIERRSGSKPR